MVRHTLIGLAALLSATSCTPAAPTRTAAAPARPITDPSALLRGLALDVPTGALAAAAQAAGGPVDGAPLPLRTAAAPPFLSAAGSVDDAARAVDCLTAAVYYEARSQSLDGQRAVAQVVLNRVRDRAFPATVCGVVYQGHERRTGCQFSFTCDGSMLRPLQPVAWERSRAVAVAALSGSVYAPIGSSTFYHANYVLPWWASSLTQVVQVGAHIFYRWRNAMERALAFRQAYAGTEPIIPAYQAATAVAATSGATSDPANVRYTLDSGAVVDVHRAGATDPAPKVAAAAVGGTIEPAAPRFMMIGGVRVHRGIDGADAASSNASSEINGVTVHRAGSADPSPAQTTT